MARFDSLVDKIRDRAASVSDKRVYTFLRNGEEEAGFLTFAELDRQARVVGTTIQSLGLAGECVLLVFPPNGPEFITAYLGCLYSGAIAVPVYPPRPNEGDRFLALVKDSGARVALTTSSLKLRLSLATFGKGIKWMTVDPLRKGLEKDWTPRSLSEDSVAFLQYTSGSTSIPRGVVVTHGNLMANLRMSHLALNLGPSDIMMSWIPVYHDMGLIGQALNPLQVGNECIFMSPLDFLQRPMRWMEAMSRYGATQCSAPNFSYDLVVRKSTPEQRAALDLSRWRIALNGAEPVKADTLDRFSKAFACAGFDRKAFMPAYGLAEATLIVAADSPPATIHISASAMEAGEVLEVPGDRDDARELVSCGSPCVGLDVRIVDPERRLPCGPGALGEIWIAGPSVAHGYWRNEEATQESFRAHLSDSEDGPFLRTGDLGFFHRGELFVAGRLKDLLIIRGKNHYPQDIEYTVESCHEALRPGCSAAFTVEGEDEQLVVVAELYDGYKGKSTAEIAAAVERAVALNHGIRPAAVQFLKGKSIPKTSSGKIRRRATRQAYLAGKLAKLSHHLFHTDSAPVIETQPYRFSNDGDEMARATKPMPTLSSHVSESTVEADRIIEWFRSYAERRLNSRLSDERRMIPPHVVLDFGNEGLLGLNVPRELGGRGLSQANTNRVLEQVAAFDITLALFIGVHLGLGIRPLLRYASQNLRERIVPALSHGRTLGSFALTEPGAGSNPHAMDARAQRVPGGWRVNADKCWIGSGSWAGVITVFAKAFGEDGHPQGTVALAVFEDNPGLSHGPEALTMGVRGMVQNTIYLRDAFVPDDQVVGEPGDGMRVAQDAMMLCRLGLGAISLGAMKRSAQLLHRYASRRCISTGRHLDNPVTLEVLTDTTCAIQAVEAYVGTLARLLDEGAPVPDEAYLACKISGPELLFETVDRLVQALGGRGYLESNGVPQMLRDARLLRIFEGPTETLAIHLGGLVFSPEPVIVPFLRETLGAPQWADELSSVAGRLRTLYLEKVEPTHGRSQALHWCYHTVGWLAALALVGAAVDAAPTENTQAPSWVRRRFGEILTAARRKVEGQPLPSTESIEACIASYRAQIGDLESALPGEDQDLDVLLRRDGDAWPTLPRSEVAQPAHALTVDFQKSTERECSQVRVPSPPPAVPAPSPVVSPSDAPDLGTRLVSIVSDWLRTNKPGNEVITPETSFFELGLDSLDMVELAHKIEAKTDIHIESEWLFDYRTPAQLARRLAQAQPGVSRAAEKEPEAVSVIPASLGTGLQRYQPSERLKHWRASGRYFFKTEITRQEDPWALVGGRRMLIMGSYSYLGFLQHPEIIEASREATAFYGAGAHGVRVLTGTTNLHVQLEGTIARFFESEDAIVYSSGYVANVSTVSTLVGPGDVVIGDEWNHASIVDGCKLSGAEFMIFKHNDLTDLEACLKRSNGRHTLVVVDGVYSMQGDIADLPGIIALCKRFGAILMVDEAHSLGVIGHTGRGVQEYFNLAPDDIDIKMGCLSKALATCGGYVAGRADIVDYLRHNARGYIFSSAMPAGTVAASQAAFRILEREPERVAHLEKMRALYSKGLGELGFDTFGSHTPIVPIRCNSEEEALNLTYACRKAGLLVVPVFYPAVPMNAPRLRTCVTASHQPEDIQFALQVLASIAPKMRSPNA